MNILEAKELKLGLEKTLYNELEEFESLTGLEVAAVLINRADVSQIGESRRSQLVGLEIVAGIDVPATPKEAM